MRKIHRILAAVALLSTGLLVNACALTPEEEAPAEADDAIAEAGEELRFQLPISIQLYREISFTQFEDDIGAAGAREARQIITSQAGYRRLFGHDAPGVDFSQEWVLFYSAGEKPTGGYAASVESIRVMRGGVILDVTTSLLSPGDDCVVTQAFTRPYALVKFARQVPRPRFVRYRRDDQARDCTPPQQTASCAAILCLQGTYCVEDETGQGRCLPISPCASDADCRAVADYCTGCDCRALGPREELPFCDGPGVRCLRDPCDGQTAVCEGSLCVLR
jgi:hypothetical protein